MKTEGLGCSSRLILQGTEDLGVLSFDGGPFLSTLFGPTKAKGKLKDVIDGALEEIQGRGPRTVGCTVVQGPVRHPGCTASALPVFVVRIH